MKTASKNFFFLLVVAVTTAYGDESGNCTAPAPTKKVILRTSDETIDLPKPGVEIDPATTAIVMTDPQNDFLREDGVAWPVVGKNVEENGVVEHLLDLFKIAKERNILVFISPHYYYAHDHRWLFEGALEKLMHDIKMYDRKGVVETGGFEGSGADYLDIYKPYIAEDNVIVCHAHKMFGPETNDLVLQLRKRRISKVLLAGMSANLCTESHMRELAEQGFEVAVINDATAAAQTETLDGYAAALTNFAMFASASVTTAETLAALKEAFPLK